MMLNAFSSKTRFVIRYALGCWASLWLGLPAMGEFPEKPITVIVPFAAGGGSGVFVRIFQQAIRENNLSPHPIVVKNISGAGGTIGSRTAREAEPDGHTILCLHDGIYTAQHYGNADWGPSDFEPLAATGRSGVVIAVRGKSPFDSLAELMEEAVKSPYELVFGTNLGAPNHYSALFLQKGKPGAKFRFTQTGGGAKRLAQLKGGHIDLTGFSIAEYEQFKAAGIKALAVLSEVRESSFPIFQRPRSKASIRCTESCNFGGRPKARLRNGSLIWKIFCVKPWQPRPFGNACATSTWIRFLKLGASAGNDPSTQRQLERDRHRKTHAPASGRMDCGRSGRRVLGPGHQRGEKGMIELFSDPSILGLVLLGTILGITVGAVPGLTGTMLIALSLPLTFSMEPVAGLVLLVAMYVGAVSGGLISATLLRMPGTPAAVMTTLDGYPMAISGRPGRALGLGVGASLFGGLVSWLALWQLSEPMADWSTKLGPFELFSLVVLALALLAGWETPRGPAVCSPEASACSWPCGMHPATGELRWTLGMTSMNEGFRLIPVLIGMFAIGKILEDITGKGGTVEKVAGNDSAWIPLGAWQKQLANLFRSSGIGTLIGVLPGVGANIGSLAAYMAAKRASNKPEDFGKGSEDGIVASESANNATVGGALIPLIALGVPGSVIGAVLLGALIVHGLQLRTSSFPAKPRCRSRHHRNGIGSQPDDVLDHGRLRPLDRQAFLRSQENPLPPCCGLLHLGGLRSERALVRRRDHAPFRPSGMEDGKSEATLGRLRHRLRFGPRGGRKLVRRTDGKRRQLPSSPIPSHFSLLPSCGPLPSSLEKERFGKETLMR